MSLTAAEKQAAYRERKRMEELEAAARLEREEIEWRERQQEEAEQEALESILTTERHEQEVRAKFGYTASETRTERERSGAAARMLKRDPQEYWDSRH